MATGAEDLDLQPAVLDIELLKFSIGQTHILDWVDLRVAAGETVGIIGPNGSGKTTLFNCLSGFSMPDSGKIAYKDHDITFLPPHQRASLGLGRVFQNSGVFREMSLLDNMLAALEGRQNIWEGFNPWSKQIKELKAQAFNYLSEVGLQDRADDKAGSLSGGQMRLLEIIRTLAFGADLFLLDEPTAGVSPKMKEDVAGLIRKLQGLGKTILVIEHDLTFIQKFCRRIVVLDGGKVIMDDSPEEIRNDSLLQEIYFGSASV